MEKVAPSERFRYELDEVLAGVAGEQDPIETVGRLGARLILQQALEDEVSEFLGRARYERAEETVSHRNGYESRRVKTTSGSMRLERPRVRNASSLGFESRVLGKGVARTHALESLVISSFLRGLSTRDVEAALEEVFEEPIASKSTVSRICDDTRERYRQWCRRRLEQHDVVYLFLDAIYLKLRPEDQPAEGVLVCWGVTLEGRKVLLGLQLGSRESYESWLSFGRDMIGRGLRAPAPVIADGAPGIWKAVRELWPAALEQRCTVHALRNVTSKLPERHHAEVKARWWRIFDEARSAGEARQQLHEPPGEDLRGGPQAHQGDRSLPRRDIRPVTHLGRARALLPRLARREDEPQDRRGDRAATPRAAPATTLTEHRRRRGGDRRITFPSSGATPERFHPGTGTRPRCA
jgi:putative transposase